MYFISISLHITKWKYGLTFNNLLAKSKSYITWNAIYSSKTVIFFISHLSNYVMKKCIWYGDQFLSFFPSFKLKMQIEIEYQIDWNSALLMWPKSFIFKEYYGTLHSITILTLKGKVITSLYQIISTMAIPYLLSCRLLSNVVF